MPRITGVTRVKAMLTEKAKSSKRVVGALYAAGQDIELDAERSITSGSVSGKNHVPSAPGQPPNADTRFLDTNIETRIESSNPPRVVVESKAPYSAPLEFGTSKMAERPFMRPAVARNRKKMAQRIAKALAD